MDYKGTGNMTEELVKTLQEQIEQGAEVVAFTVVLKKNYVPYVLTHDTWGKDVFIDEI